MRDAILEGTIKAFAAYGFWGIWWLVWAWIIPAPWAEWCASFWWVWWVGGVVLIAWALTGRLKR